MTLAMAPSTFLFGYFTLIAFAFFILLILTKQNVFKKIITRVIYVLLSPLCFAIFLGALSGLIEFHVTQPRLNFVNASDYERINLDPTYRLYGKSGDCLIGWYDMTMMPFQAGQDVGYKIAAVISPNKYKNYKGPYPSEEEAVSLLKTASSSKELKNYLKGKGELPFAIHRRTVNAILFDMEQSDFRDRITGDEPLELPDYFFYELDDSDNPAFQWAKCGPSCSVIRPIYKFNKGYIPHHTIFLLDNDTSIVFARYEHFEHPVFD